jgi:hypothetical protein
LKKTSKKLSIKREVLKSLTDAKLDGAVGGLSSYGGTNYCSSESNSKCRYAGCDAGTFG